MKRKPRGYWDEFANLEREIRLLITSHGLERDILTKRKLIALGRQDLVNAIQKHGGLSEVAQRIGLNTAYKPPHYWDDFANLKKELGTFITEYDTNGKMPSAKELIKAGRSDLANALRRHGGLPVVAEQLGLKSTAIPRSRKPSGPRKAVGYWNDFANVEKELRIFVAKYGTVDTMPTKRLLKLEKRNDLLSAIRKYGGFQSVANRIGLTLQDSYKPDGYWNDFANVEKELRAFLRECGNENDMPTVTKLVRAKRRSLAQAISQHGGFGKVAQRLGLKYSRKPTESRKPKELRKPPRYWERFDKLEKELRDFIREHGEANLMPTANELVAAGRMDLANAIHKHGGYSRVAKRLNLATLHKQQGYWDTFENIEKEIREFAAKQSSVGIMPTITQLKAAGKGDLINAINKHGGVSVVAQRLGMESSYKSMHYWDDFQNVEKELRAVIAEKDLDDAMPSSDTLVRAGLASLSHAIQRHGGATAVAQRLGLKPSNRDKPSGYWSDFENVAKALHEYILRNGGKGVMPSLRELNNKGFSALSRAIDMHGGFFSVARRLELLYTGHEYLTSYQASSVEQTARAIQPLAESNALSGAQVMVILRRAGLLDYRNQRILRLNAGLARGNHEEIESAIANLVSGGEEIATESVIVSETDTLSASEAEALASVGLDARETQGVQLNVPNVPDTQQEQNVIRGLSALGELRLPLDQVLQLLTSKILWQAFYKRLYSWYGSLDAVQTVTSDDVNAAILSAYPEHTANEFVAEASVVFAYEVKQAVNFAASLADFGWCGPRLRLHQADAARRMAEVLGRDVQLNVPINATFLLDADDPGMGKTASFLAAVCVSDIQSILIIAPKTVADDTWIAPRGEIRRCLPHARIVRGIADTLKTKDASQSQLTLFVLHYEELLNESAVAKLSQRQFACLCLDEIHFVKQRAGQEPTNRRDALETLRACARMAIGLTGTPLINELAEPMSLLQVLSQHAPQFDHSRLSNRRMSDIADVFEAMLPHIIRRRKSETLLHLPQCDIRPVPISLPPDIETQMLETYRWNRSRASEALVELRKLATTAKLPYLQERALTTRKLLILTYLTDDVSEKIFAYIDDFLPNKVAHINGQTPKDERQRALDSFRSPNGVRVLVGTVGTIGTGLTLFDPRSDHTANEIIFADLPYTFAEFDQGIARLYREGQKERVRVDVLQTTTATTLKDGSALHTLDERIWELIENKRELADIAIDGKYDTSDASTKVLKALRRWLKQAREIGIEPLAVERRRDEQTPAEKWRSEIGRLRGMSAAKADETFANPEYTREFLAHLKISTAANLSHQWLRGKLGLLLRPDLEIVDMGCGLNPFADLPCRVIGLDRHDLPGQLRGKMENPPLPDKSADVLIYSLSLYGTASDLMNYFTHAARILRGGGHLFIVEPDSSFSEQGQARFIGGLRQFGFELVGTVKELRGEDGALLKGMHLTLTGEVGKPEIGAFERK